MYKKGSTLYRRTRHHFFITCPTSRPLCPSHQTLTEWCSFALFSASGVAAGEDPSPTRGSPTRGGRRTGAEALACSCFARTHIKVCYWMTNAQPYFFFHISHLAASMASFRSRIARRSLASRSTLAASTATASLASSARLIPGTLPPTSSTVADNNLRVPATKFHSLVSVKKLKKRVIACYQTSLFVFITKQANFSRVHMKAHADAQCGERKRY